MFSLDRFYNILHSNLIDQFQNGRSVYFYPFGTYQHRTILHDSSASITQEVDYHNRSFTRTWFHSYFFDQEPIYESTLDIVKKSFLVNDIRIHGINKINVLANSEKSELKNNFLKAHGFYDWYYFYHGFAALDWYRDFQYYNSESFNGFDKVFICYNHLTSKYRSYRLHLVSNLIEQNLLKHGLVSLFHNGWQQTIEDPDNLLDNRARVKIYQTLRTLDKPLTIDTDNPTGELSAIVNFADLKNALWHVVTETVYFQSKLHLTEKIFKPIVAKRPFILVGAPGNLAYLKSYGFHTFDRWIDESYDNEQDHYIRIEKITTEINKLCQLSKSQLEKMYIDMQEILEFNFKHFYNGFKNNIVNELVDNFEHVLCRINNGRQPNNHSRYHKRFDLNPQYLLDLKTKLKQ